MEDYLDEDTVLKTQQFVCLSLFIPGKEEEGDDQDSRCGIKVRGSYATMEQAEARVQELKKTDKFHHIYIGEVGKWLPFNPRPEEAGKEIYPDKELNELMKNYKENRVKCNEVHEERANQLSNEIKKDNKQNNKKKKKKKKKNVDPDVTYLNDTSNDGALSIDVDSDEGNDAVPVINEEVRQAESIDDVLEQKLSTLATDSM